MSRKHFGGASEEICFRPLRKKDAEAYKALRLEALEGKDGRFFVADVAAEKARTLDDWRKVCDETCRGVIMGAFQENKLLGAMSICICDKDKTTAYKHSAYVRPAYRETFKGTNIGATLDAERDDWAREHGVKSIVLAMRADNEHWLETQKAKGAVEFKRDEVRYADGQVAPGIWLRYTL
jgi:hypothetical protein